MERVYSAFFTVDRPTKETPPLTAEALEKHNETHRATASTESSKKDSDTRGLSGSGPLDPRQSDTVLVHHYHDTDDDGAARRKKSRRGGGGEDDGSEYVDAHRRELTHLTFNFLEIKRDLKSALKAALRGACCLLLVHVELDKPTPI